MSVEDLFGELILDHFKHPRGRNAITSPDAASVVYNPLCGDQVGVAVKLSNNCIEDIGFSGQGCSISQAAASMVCSLCKGKTVDEVKQLSQSFRAILRGESRPDRELLGDALALEGVKQFPVRTRCALLAWEALEKCLISICSNLSRTS